MSFRVPAGLLVSNINAYSAEGYARKRTFHQDGRRFLKQLAVALTLPNSSFDLRRNEAGIAVSGEVTLHSDTLYVQLYESAVCAGVSVLYRRCRGRRDYCGETNHFVAAADLVEPARLERFVKELKTLGGIVQDLRLAA